MSNEDDGYLVMLVPISHKLKDEKRPTFPISRSFIAPSSPNFILKSRSLAKSEIFDILLGPVDEKCALYPKVEMRAVAMSGSRGSHSLGQNKLGSPSFVHVRKLVPPRPCRNKMSAVGGCCGEYKTVSPRGSLLRSVEELLRKVRAAVDERDDTESKFASSAPRNCGGSVSPLAAMDEGDEGDKASGKDKIESELSLGSGL